MKKALLIVDVQRDFCPGGALAVPNGDEVIEPLNRMVDFATQDEQHWAEWTIFASGDQHPRKTKHFKKWGGLWPIHCVAGTPGAEFHPELKTEYPEFGVIAVSKGTVPNENGYSAFEARTSWGQSFEKYFRSCCIQEVYIGGLATDYCVKATVLDAIKLGFKTYLLIDACRAVNVNPGDDVRALSEMANAGVKFITTDEVIYGTV